MARWVAGSCPYCINAHHGTLRERVEAIEACRDDYYSHCKLLGAEPFLKMTHEAVVLFCLMENRNR